LIRKYCSEPRFFEQGLIRFTQPGALNDPAEARPEIVIGKYAPDDYVRARGQAQQSGYDWKSDTDLEIFLTPFPSRRYDDKSFPRLWPATEPRLRKESFSTLEEMDRAIAERAIELCLATADRTIGVLSLSESIDEAVWAYYAAGHAGLAICFDDNHPFFKKTSAPLVYSDIPIHVSTNFGWVRLGGHRWNNEDILNSKVADIPDDLFFRKRSGWAHEREFRVIRPLIDAMRSGGNDSNGYTIHLFEVPPSAVQTVIFGYRAPYSTIQWTLAQIEGEKRWGHIRVARRKRMATGRIEEECIR
jgi:hypothetical protein